MGTALRNWLERVFSWIPTDTVERFIHVSNNEDNDETCMDSYSYSKSWHLKMDGV